MSAFMRGKYVGYYARLTNNFNFIAIFNNTAQYFNF